MRTYYWEFHAHTVPQLADSAHHFTRAAFTSFFVYMRVCCVLDIVRTVGSG